LDSSGNFHGCLYNGTSWTKLTDLAAGPIGTAPNGISGTNIVGDYWDSSGNRHGFLYDGNTWTTLNDPNVGDGTSPQAILGNSIFGVYDDSSGTAYGFIATPTMLQLAITQSGGGLNVSWPYPSAGWTLQQNPDLSTTNWTPAPTGGISNDGTNNYYIVTPSPGNLLFRLRQ
jgi:hypothetical protein